MPDLRIIVVGSSAGGLDALTKLLGAVHPGLGWCFVIAQHLSPTEPSVLASLLSRTTDLRVVEAIDGAELEADVVFVTPPGVDIVVNDRVVGLVEAFEAHRPWPSIDRLLTSAAQWWGANAVGLVLSGTGEDGASGVQSIKGAGGVVLVQDQMTAAFGGMPGAAFATGAADLQLPPEEIPRELERILLADALFAKVSDDDARARRSWQEIDDAAVESVIIAMRTATGVDYSGYKRSTVRRQLERRLRILDAQASDYIAGLAEDAVEVEALSQYILIGVTAFFRDSQVWAGLADHLTDLVDSLGPGTPIRVWVPGCATGEEAYTIAILVAEALGPTHGDLSGRMKIFATDLDDRALSVARRARYSDGAVSAVPPALRGRWFRRVDKDWELIPTLRECIVVARHNVAFDPPFPRIHLISLRNTMIYFQPYLQERVLQFCQFALVPDGLLLLGQSERVPRADALFANVDPEHRLYRRRHTSGAISLPASRYVPAVRVTPAQPVVRIGRDHSALLYRRLLRALAPPSIVVDDQDTVTEVIGDVSLWCTVAEGRHTGNVGDLLREPYRLVVRTMLSQLRHSAPETVVREIDSDEGRLEIAVARVVAEGVGAVVSFRTSTHPPEGIDIQTSTDDAVLQVTAALESAQEALQATVEDLSSSNEELQALNEELQASTEELQATSEEVQASNEELEAANEELTTLNQELQARSRELMGANTDLENIQASLTSGLVIVDREMRVVRYTPLVVRLFSLIRADIGRPLPAVPTTIPIPSLADDLRITMASKTPRLIELSSGSRDLLVQTQPYFGSSGDVRGALVVVVDVSDVMHARREREMALSNLENVAESVRELVWQRDTSGAITFLTSRVEEIYGLDRERVLADPGLLAAAVHPDDRSRVAAAWASAERRWQLEYRIVRPDGSIRWIEESAAHTAAGPNVVASITGSALDVTERHDLQVAATQRGAVLEAVVSSETVGFLILDGDDRILQASATMASIIGSTADSLVRTRLSAILAADHALPAGRDAPSDAGGLETGRIVSVDGTTHSVTFELLRVAAAEAPDDRGGPCRVAVVYDVSRLRQVSADLASRQQFDQQTGLLTRTYFRSRTEELLRTGIAGIAVLWIDLDGFKEVNDRFGHRAGDDVLAKVSMRLLRNARKHDVIGRLGGDEFAMLVTRVQDLDELEPVVHRILSAVREPIDIDGTLAYVSASIGIAVHPRDGRTAEELLHNADTAMYVAKRRGRDRHAYFAEEMNEGADERAELRHQLAAAVRGSDFVLHYQPIIDVATRRVAHVEALLRWHRGEEIVSAEQFLGLAAETGQLRAIGRIVLRLLDADIATLHNSFGVNQPSVAVNLSGIELEERDTIDWLLGWNPAGGFNKVIAEVTESAFVGPDSRVVDTLTILRRLGAKISIDDFGTGYSNLDLLDTLAPDIIKIDRSLLNRAVVNERGLKILQAAARMAHALDTEIVVEGVADESMWSLVVDLGAEFAQGFYLAKPMSLSNLIEWIVQHEQSNSTN